MGKRHEKARRTGEREQWALTQKSEQKLPKQKHAQLIFEFFKKDFKKKIKQVAFLIRDLAHLLM